MVKYNNEKSSTLEADGVETRRLSLGEGEKYKSVQEPMLGKRKHIGQKTRMIQILHQAIIWSEVLDKPVSKRRRSRGAWQSR